MAFASRPSCRSLRRELRLARLATDGFGLGGTGDGVEPAAAEPGRFGSGSVIVYAVRVPAWRRSSLDLII